MKAWILAGILVVGGAAVAVCWFQPWKSGDDNFGGISRGERPKTTATEAQMKRYAEANNAFAFNIFDKIRKEDKDKNVFISPASLSFALAMTCNAAASETKDAMVKTLALEGMSIEEVNVAAQGLKVDLEYADPKVQLLIANSLWSANGPVWGTTIKSEFVKVVQDCYFGEARQVNFTDKATVKAVNDWCSEKTYGRIPTITNGFDEYTAAVLLNAVYFKGEWTEKFKKEHTRDGDFHLLGDKTRSTPFMCNEDSYSYVDTGKAQAIRLCYGQSRMAMYVVLPAKDLSLDAFLGGLTPKAWDELIRGMGYKEGAITLPCFKLAYEKNCNESLIAAGMGVAFDARKADFTNGFSGIRPDKKNNIFIGLVRHKTFLDVTEEGTEAAAVTMVQANAPGCKADDPFFFMTVDRPFFCAICDTQTGAIVFMGAIYEP